MFSSDSDNIDDEPFDNYVDDTNESQGNNDKNILANAYKSVSPRILLDSASSSNNNKELMGSKFSPHLQIQVDRYSDEPQPDDYMSPQFGAGGEMQFLRLK